MVGSVDPGLKFYGKVLKESLRRFADEQAPTHSAALAYSMVFSLPPMLLIIVWAAGLVYEEALVREAISSEFTALVGADGAQQLMATLGKFDIQKPTRWATAIAAFTLLASASAVLVAGQNALNRIFGVKAAKPAALGIWRTLRDKVISFGMLVTIALILSVSLVLDALAALVWAFLQQSFGIAASWMSAIDLGLIDVGAMTLLFAMLFRYLPDEQLEWKFTWSGALTTAILFGVGQYLIGFLIGRSQVASLYDAAGSVMVIMLWVYYASAVFLFGASFTASRAEALATDENLRASSARPIAGEVSDPERA